MQSTLEEILARHDWISTFTHPPDVLALLRTNDAPSPPQSARLKASFEGLQTALAELQSNLDLLHNVAASLQTQMSCFLSLKHDYETVLSPIRRIPSEIAMEILCRSWKDAEFSDISLGRRPAGFNVFRIREGPWYLGQVCSSWRNVIETLCPELWATMIVNLRISFPYERLFGNLVEILRIVLERSRNHPLSFSFRFHGTEVEESNIPEIEQCFDTMITHSKRWKAVDLTIPPDLHGDIHAFEIAPALEQLHLKGIHQAANIHFPTSNLVSFSDARSFAGDRLTAEYLHIIKSSPKLRSFSYNDYGVQSLDILPLVRPPVMSPSVEELSVSSPNFMRSLVLPSLKDVTLSTNAHEKDMEEEVMSCPVGALGALHEMLLKSRCSLSRLSLIDAVLDDNLTNIIRLMPGLQEFMINFNEWVGDYDPIMQSLVTQLSEVSLVDGTLQHSVVPSLQSLYVYLFNVRYSHVSFINSAFVDMVASRLRRPSDAPRLTEFDLHMSGLGGSFDLDEEAENVLASLKDEGLRLNYYIRMDEG
ncbi:uncharacterized protein ARMOST_14544 [Armillaria ostoyae]|uniref:F-box domain-containing protein n=1 Tax=Armillaria ostoyae TaxID=47428 RepID=A0A284RQV9_ARMOS|nr:uncharacterized protein ARMOST_14544 [Armillaria ostoyae]